MLAPQPLSCSKVNYIHRFQGLGMDIPEGYFPNYLREHL